MTEEYDVDGERFRFRPFRSSGRGDVFSGMGPASKWLLLDDIEARRYATPASDGRGRRDERRAERQPRAVVRGARRVSPKRYDQLTDALAGMQCRTLIEVGTWNGERAKELVAAALRRNPAITYHGFDLFEALTEDELNAELSKRPPSHVEVEASLRRLQQRLGWRLWARRSFDFELHQGYTRDTLPAFRAAHHELRAEFIFIDGGHSIETIANDWANCSELVAPDGSIFLDDFYGNEQLAHDFGCNQLIASLWQDEAWEVTVLPGTDEFPEIGTIQVVRVRPA